MVFIVLDVYFISLAENIAILQGGFKTPDVLS